MYAGSVETEPERKAHWVEVVLLVVGLAVLGWLLWLGSTRDTEPNARRVTGGDRMEPTMQSRPAPRACYY